MEQLFKEASIRLRREIRMIKMRMEIGSESVGRSGPMKVLVVDDSPVYRQLIKTQLEEWGYQVSLASDGTEAWNILQRSDSPKLVILDWVLPGINGIDLCRRIRNRVHSYVYTVLLTGKDRKEDWHEAMSAGADDFLSKPFDALELKARLLVGKRIIDLQDALVSTQESMRYAATHDALTGLRNRGEILSFLDRELAKAKREKRKVGILLADLDEFKSINDSLGHLFGDQVLKETARRIASKARVYDGVGRYGGEEFLVILVDCDLTTTLIRAEEIRSYVGSSPVVQSGKRRTATLSIGVAIGDGSTQLDADRLLNEADEALYQAKRLGRNRVEHQDLALSRP